MPDLSFSDQCALDMFAAGWDTAAWALGNQDADTSELCMPFIADYTEGIVAAMETVVAFDGDSYVE